ncbi:hypothetical protein MJH12_17920, partial [bacterium]|nr:hypothetical protein [bacterium]
TPTIVRNAPVSTAFTTDYGNERLTLFPKGTIADEKKRINGLLIENSDEKPLQSPRDEKTIKEARSPESERKLASSKSIPETIGDSPIDFSSFLKKIKYLKERKNQTNLKNDFKKSTHRKKEKGFDNLIKMLEKDIVQSEKVEVAATAKKEQKQKAILDTKIDQKKQDASDSVMGDRAQKIANLLNLWEEEPEDSLTADEDQKELPQSSQNESQSTGQSSDASSAKEKEKSQKTAKKAVKKAPKKAKVFAPLVEDPIEMELLSPLDVAGFDKGKLLDVGKFNLGNMKFIEKKAKKNSIKKNSGKKSKRPKKRRRKKKLSYLEFNDELSFEEEIEEPKIKRSSSLSLGMNQKLAQKIETPQNKKNWEDDFFEKDLAFVVYADDEVEIEEQELDDLRNTHQKKTRTKKKTFGKKVINKLQKRPKPSQLAQFINAKSENRKEKKIVKMKSSNPRTQQIFENLFKENGPKKSIKDLATKAPRKILARSSNRKTQNIFDNLLKVKQEKLVEKQSFAKLKKPKIHKSQEEDDFESFLDDMFDNAKVQETEKKVIPVKKRSKKKESLSKLEEEFMSFLEEL